MTTQKMLAGFRRAIEEYSLIRDGDKIAVGLSGGKDSVTLLKLFAELKKFYPVNFDIIAVTVDVNVPEYPNDFTPLIKFCEELGVKYIIEKIPIFREKSFEKFA
jgi:tRNA(Ile)-lysidine synthase TilS/MesJ